MTAAPVTAKLAQTWSGPERRSAERTARDWRGPLRRSTDVPFVPSFAHLAPAERSVLAVQRSRLTWLQAPSAHAIAAPAEACAALGQVGLVNQMRAFVHGSGAQDRLPPRKPAVSLTELVRRGNCLDSELHDTFFGVLRSEGPAMFVHAVVAGMDKLRAEARQGSHDGRPENFVAAAEGLRLAFRIGTGFDPGAPKLAKPRSRTITPAGASRRWLRGHQIFLVLTQAMLIVLAEMEENATSTARIDAVDKLCALMQASSAAMWLTGDFAPQIYEHLIRPAMAPPFMPDSFSGLFSSDHKLLVSRLRGMRSMFELGDNRLVAARSALATSFAAVYDSHIAVCTRFVGTDRKSLLMNDDANCDAIEQLEKFKRSRVRLVEGR